MQKEHGDFMFENIRKMQDVNSQKKSKGSPGAGEKNHCFIYPSEYLDRQRNQRNLIPQIPIHVRLEMAMTRQK